MDPFNCDVLIVGREQEAALLVSKHVQKNGYRYTLARTPEEGLQEGTVAVAVVCCSHEEMNTGLDNVSFLSHRDIPVLVLLDGENAYASELLKARGALAICSMPLNTERFQDAFDTVVYKQEIRRHKSSMIHHAKTLQRLTPRERRVVQLAADGKPNKQIANNVGLSVKSIERIRRDAYRKLNVRSTAEMTRVFLLGSLYPDVGGPTEPAF